MSINLTSPQRELLRSLGEGNNCSPDYRPAVALVNKGLAYVKAGQLGTRVILTESGIEQFKKLKPCH